MIHFMLDDLRSPAGIGLDASLHLKCLIFYLYCTVTFTFAYGYADVKFTNDPDAIEKAAESVLMLEIYDA